MASAPANVVFRYLRQLATSAETDPLPDRELLARFVAQRDEEGFAALVRRHGSMVWRLCRRSLQSEHDAEDVFQATFLVLHRKAAALERCESLAGWLYGVASRLAMKVRTASARRRARERRAASPSPPDPLAEISVREAQDILDQELLRMPEKLRAPLVLCCLEGCTRDEAAQRLGWSVSLVKSRLEQARELLSKRLSRRGLAPSAAFLTLLVGGHATRAVVPGALSQATVQAALQVAAGNAAGVSATALALAEGLLNSVVLTKLKGAMAILLLMSALGLGAVSLVGPAGSSSGLQPESSLKPEERIAQVDAGPLDPAGPVAEEVIGIDPGEEFPTPQTAQPAGTPETASRAAPPAKVEPAAEAPRSVRRKEPKPRADRSARARLDDDWWERGRPAGAHVREDDDDWLERAHEKESPRTRNRPKREDRPHD